MLVSRKGDEMQEHEKRTKFFYAMQEAGMYDATIEFVVPCYRQMHDVMRKFAEDQSRKMKSELTLDLGFGTGIDSISLLQSIPELKIVGVDLCEPMVEIFRRKATQSGVDADRYSLFAGDILENGVLSEAKEIAGRSFGTEKFGLVISAFTIHHFDTHQKIELIRRIHEFLEPGGVFILGDLFNCEPDSQSMTDAILDWEIDWIENCFSSEADSLMKVGNHDKARTMNELKKNWVHHYMYYNQLDSVSAHIKMLLDAGFAEAANPFRHYQVGVVWAKKHD
jgi:tRNA (cmo5U34)-methyltransferase